MALPLSASRPVLKVLTTFDPAIRQVAERVHTFEAAHHCWVDWDYLERSDVAAILYGESIDYDVVSVDEPWVPALSDRLRPLADWPLPAGSRRAAHPLASWRGHCYGLMQLENYYLYVYRADVFGDSRLSQAFEHRAADQAVSPPESIEDLLALARYFQAETDYQALALVQSPAESVVIDLVWCLEAAGVELTGEYMRTRPNLAAVARGLEWFRALHRLSPPTDNTDKPHSLEGINQVYSRGEVAHLLQWTGFAEQLRNPLFSRVGTKTSFAPLPGSDDRPPFCITGHWFLAIPSAPETQVELAAAFIDWYQATVQDEIRPLKELKQQLEEVDKFSRPRSVDYLKLSECLYAMAERLLEHDLSPVECADRLIRDFRQITWTHGEMQP